MIRRIATAAAATAAAGLLIAPPASAAEEPTARELLEKCDNGTDSCVFHPEGERGNQRRSRADRAKAVCDSCPVLQRCRDHALASREPYGVWGGLSEDERAAVLAERGRAARIS